MIRASGNWSQGVNGQKERGGLREETANCSPAWDCGKGFLSGLNGISSR